MRDAADQLRLVWRQRKVSDDPMPLWILNAAALLDEVRNALGRGEKITHIRTQAVKMADRILREYPPIESQPPAHQQEPHDGEGT